QTVVVPILAMNRAKWIWGEDAAEFRPERWASVPEAAMAIPGIWGNMLSFLGGPRACIGYKFSLVETKALLFTLIRSFEFELAVPVEDLTKRSTIVQRPVLKSDPEGHSQLPLLIKPVSQSWM
ncbi:cytochrome P450, partial [Pluteus cervinus]